MDNSMASAGNSVGSMPPQRKPVRTLKVAAIPRQGEVGGRVVAAIISGIMRRAAQDEVQRNQVAGIEQMIDACGDFAAVAVKRLAGIIGAAVDFVVAVGEPAARQADGQSPCSAPARGQSRIRNPDIPAPRQPQRQVRAQEIRLVVIVKRVAGKWRVTFERLVVAELDQVALDRINLRKSQKSGRTTPATAVRARIFSSPFS